MDEILTAASKCAKCGYCTEDLNSYAALCPSTAKFPFESYRPSGKMELARALMAGELDWSEIALQRISMCTLCGACDEQCRTLTGKSPLAVFSRIRKEFVGRGISLPQHARLVSNTLKHDNPNGQPREDRLRWLSGNTARMPFSPKPRANLLYFMGCTPSLSVNLPNHILATMRVLNLAKVEFAVMRDEPCCAITSLRMGYQSDKVFNYMKQALARISDTGAKRVIFSCPGCYKAFKVDYPDAGLRPDFEPITNVEFIDELIGNAKLVPKPLASRVTYHDPCLLGRLGGVYDEPREIIRSIPSLEFVELKRRRETSWCCGLGGGVKVAFPDFSVWCAGERLKEAQEVGATTLVTACPACESNFIDAKRAFSFNISVKDISELFIR